MSIVEFGAFSLDLERCELRQESTPVRAQRKIFDLLAYLITHRDRLVSKDELFRHVWAGTAVSDSSLGRTVSQLRRLLDDDARNPRWITTVHGRGYRFVGEVRVVGPGEPEPVDLDLLEIATSATVPPTRDPRLLPCGIPRDVSTDFVGREDELKYVLDALQDRQSVRIAASIEGLPGIGKTELALQICGVCDRERRFRIFWFDAEQPDLSSAWADVVAPHLGLQASSPQARAQLALRALESMDEDVLVVLDNVEEWTASLPGPRPRGANLRWLVTTRTSNLGGRKFRHIEVPVLDSVASEQLMVRIVGPEIVSRPGFAALMEALGGYTISVELAATFLHRFPETTPAEYLAELEAGRGAEQEAEVGERSLYGQTLERALELLWARLPDRVRQSWRLAACFAQAPASAELSDACGLDRRARAELRDHHLIEAHPTRGWSMHRLVRAFGRHAADDAQRAQAEGTLFDGCCTRTRTLSLYESFRVYRTDRAHFDAVLERAHLLPPDRLEALCWLKMDIGQARRVLGEYARAIDLIDEVVTAADRVAEGASLRVHAQGNLGLLHRDLGDLNRSRSVLTEAIEGAIQTFGEDHVQVNELRSALSLVLLDTGELREAKVIAEQVLDHVSTHSPENADQVGQALENLGTILYRAGELDRAREALERSLDLALSIAQDPDHLSVLFRRSWLGSLLRDLGHTGEARKLFDLALASCVRALGEDHSTTARFRGNIAYTLRDLGQYAEALPIHRQVYEAYLRHFGEGSAQTALARTSLVVTLRELGRFAEARELLERALANDRRCLGEEHYRVAIQREYLGALHHDLGELDLALEHLEPSLRTLESVWDKDHYALGGTRARLAMLLRERGDLDRARSLLEQAVRCDALAGGPEIIGGPGRRADLAWVLRDLGDLDRARDLLEGALQSLAKLRADHPETAVMQARLAAVLRDLGQQPAARQLAVDALRLMHVQPEGWFRRSHIEQITAQVLESE